MFVKDAEESADLTLQGPLLNGLLLENLGNVVKEIFKTLNKGNQDRAR